MLLGKSFIHLGLQRDKSDPENRLTQMFKEGKTFFDLISEEVYSDDELDHLNFLALVEENTSSEITTPKQLVKAAKLQKMEFEYIEKSFYTAQAMKYKARLFRLLSDGFMYSDLLAVELKTFHLPKTWVDINDKTRDRETVILWVIRSFFSLGQGYAPTPYRDIAKLIEAPYSVILKAASYDI